MRTLIVGLNHPLLYLSLLILMVLVDLTIRRLVRMGSGKPVPSGDLEAAAVAGQILSGEWNSPVMNVLSNAVAKKLLGES